MNYWRWCLDSRSMPAAVHSIVFQNTHNAIESLQSCYTLYNIVKRTLVCTIKVIQFILKIKF